jgi:hypothetical protein
MRFWSLLETHFHCRHSFCENGTSLMPWAGQEGCLIDRYDGRALLDALPPPPPSCSLPPDDELLLERRVTVRATARTVTRHRLQLTLPQLFELRAFSRPWCVAAACLLPLHHTSTLKP